LQFSKGKQTPDERQNDKANIFISTEQTMQALQVFAEISDDFFSVGMSLEMPGHLPALLNQAQSCIDARR
jgi:hypothetical protein